MHKQTSHEFPSYQFSGILKFDLILNISLIISIFKFNITGIHWIFFSFLNIFHFQKFLSILYLLCMARIRAEIQTRDWQSIQYIYPLDHHNDLLQTLQFLEFVNLVRQFFLLSTHLQHFFSVKKHYTVYIKKIGMSSLPTSSHKYIITVISKILKMRYC